MLALSSQYFQFPSVSYPNFSQYPVPVPAQIPVTAPEGCPSKFAGN